MADNTFEVRGLDELIKNMVWFPKRFKEFQKLGMRQSLSVFWENVPPYPAKPPKSRYERKGSAGLGGSLGSSARGGAGDKQPQIFTAKGLGTREAEGRFGTRLSYAPYVIGDQQARQNAHWWKLKDIIPKATPKIVRVWERIAKVMVKFLDRRSSGVQ